MDTGRWAALPSAGTNHWGSELACLTYWHLPRGRYHGLFIELKTVKRLSRPTVEQVLMGKVLRKNGYCVKFCRGYGNAIRTALYYDGLPRYIEG
jgi:hypothetical protein